jgi:hypothetical protein
MAAEERASWGVMVSSGLGAISSPFRRGNVDSSTEEVHR